MFYAVYSTFGASLGFVWDTHSAPDWGTCGDCSRCVVVMRMASASWFSPLNIQVRANCTTACNRQAALQYVKLIHTNLRLRISFVYLFFLLLRISGCTKKCACSFELVSKVMLAPPPWTQRAPGAENGGWALACASRRIGLISYIHIHRDAQTEQSICFSGRTLLYSDNKK